MDNKSKAMGIFKNKYIIQLSEGVYLKGFDEGDYRTTKVREYAQAFSGVHSVAKKLHFYRALYKSAKKVKI